MFDSDQTSQNVPYYGAIEKTNSLDGSLLKGKALPLSAWNCAWILIRDSVPNIIHQFLIYVIPTLSIHFISNSGDSYLIGGFGLQTTWMYLTAIYSQLYM